MQVRSTSTFAEAATMANPHSVFDELRRHGPVHWDDRHGAWLVIGHPEAVATLKNPALSSDRVRHLLVSHVGVEHVSAVASLEGALRRSLMFRDGPDHARLRGVLAPRMSPAWCAQLASEIDRIASRRLELAARMDGFDVIADVAEEIALDVLGFALGVDVDSCRRIRDLASTNTSLFEAGNLGLEAVKELERRALSILSCVEDLVAKAPRNGGLLTFLDEAARAGELRPAEKVMLVLDLVTAGYVPLVNLIGQSVLALTDEPARRDVLGGNSTAVEELLRWVSPNQLTARICVRSTEVGGKRLREGDVVYVMLGAANRDPRVFERPNDLLLERRPNPHVAFGGGAHYCVGAALARAELRATLPRFFERFPRIRIGDVEWRSGTLRARGPTRIPIRVT